ncbi:30S ribosome-binding factor RbfA [Desulforhopalus singaporensis]|uniref:Ribosome-binding factor A n=1 Tax=Desulforhopalus singaporensis TaxID=91360 RepID=A0A1H0J9E1_9BACT|nr:30S ribosome-binding factor RbfA [Desulforhopalus singaporensis]SDO40222.1 ribosome-binding factor A [Desulforhopalus singaporensis]
MSVWDPKKTLDDAGLGADTGKKRSVRVGEAIRMELSTFLVTKVADPRLQGVSISRVEVTEDLSMAKIFFTVFGGHKEVKAAEKGFQRAGGFMRSQIAKTLNLRFTPKLQFRYDNTADKVAELEEIFAQIKNERESGENGS